MLRWNRAIGHGGATKALLALVNQTRGLDGIGRNGTGQDMAQ